MTTPPGHAMTAQAGAVAACPSCGAPCETEYDYNRKVNPTRIVAHRRYTPPAAVSVEALEGLVAELMARVEADKAKCTNDDGSYRSDAHRAAWNFADGLEHAADKIYELIKERSNG